MSFKAWQMIPGQRFIDSKLVNATNLEVERLGRTTGGEGVEVSHNSGAMAISIRPSDRLIRGRAAAGGITGRSGTLLGTGKAHFIYHDGTNISVSTDTVDVLNWLADTFEEDTDLYLNWQEEQWWVLPVSAGGGSGSQSDRCRCPEVPAYYLVTVACGICPSIYGPDVKMPKWWILTILDVQTNPYAVEPCEGVICADLLNQVVEMENESDEYANPTCTWSGLNGHCVKGELTIGDSVTTLRILDENDCVIATLTMDSEDFLCCGINTNWTQDEDDTCIVTVRVEPHECTCCPELEECPPQGKPPCKALAELCGCRFPCEFTVTVSNLASPPAVDPPGPCSPASHCCGGMNGTYTVSRINDCEWYVEGGSGGDQAASSTMLVQFTGGEWQATLRGPNGQIAVFRSVDWDCEVGATMLLVLGESTCDLGGPAEIGVIP